MSNYDARNVKAIPLMDVISRAGVEVPSGKKMIACPLPGHEDTKPSLSIDESKGLWKCHGCNQGGDSIRFIELIKGLSFPDAVNWIGDTFNLKTGEAYNISGRERDIPPPPIEYPPSGGVNVFEDSIYGDDNSHETPSDLPPSPPDTERVESRGVDTILEKMDGETIYPYHDADGVLLFEVVRKPGKVFRNRRPDGKGGWTWNREGVNPVLYRLPELIKSSSTGPVYITEGEKDTDRLREYGLTAICSVGGAGKWKADYNPYLKGLDVVILPHYDTPGRTHAEQVARSLDGVANSIRVLPLPGITNQGGDVSDWLDGGNTIEVLEKIAGDCLPWVNNPRVPDQGGETQGEGVLTADTYTAMFYGAYDLLNDFRKMPDAIRYAFPGSNGERMDKSLSLLPGSVNVIMGRPGHGKTTFMINAILNMTDAYPDKAFIFLSFEESPALLAHKFIRPLSMHNALDCNPSSNVSFSRLMEISGELSSLSRDDFIARLNDVNPVSCPPNVWKAWRDYHRLTSDQDGTGPQVIIIDGHSFTKGTRIDVDTLTRIVGFHRDTPTLKPIGAIYLDYAQKIPPPPRGEGLGRYTSRQQELQAVSDMLLQAAKVNSIPLVVGAQVNREVTKFSALTLDKLREAGDFEQDAATVIGLWHGSLADYEQSKEDDTQKPSGDCELSIKVLKNRTGELGKYTFTFDVASGLVHGELPANTDHGRGTMTEDDI